MPSVGRDEHVEGSPGDLSVQVSDGLEVVTDPAAPVDAQDKVEAYDQGEGSDAYWSGVRAGWYQSTEKHRQEAADWHGRALRFAAVGVVVGLVLGALLGALAAPGRSESRPPSAPGATGQPNAASSPAIPVRALGMLADRSNWVPNDPGTQFAIDGDGVRLTRTTPATASVRFAPDKTSDWTDYRVASRVSGLRDDIADGSAALVVLAGSGSPVEVRLDNDRIQVVQRGSEGQEVMLADKIVPFSAAHEAEVEVGQQSLSVDIDGNNLFKGNQAASGSAQPRRGGIALVARSSAKDSAASFFFDNLRVTPR